MNVNILTLVLIVLVLGCGKPKDPQAAFIQDFHAALISKDEKKIQKLYNTSAQVRSLIEAANETEEWKDRNRKKVQVFDEWKTRFSSDVQKEIYSPLFGVVWKDVKFTDYRFSEIDKERSFCKLLCAATDGKRDFKIRVDLRLINGRFYATHVTSGLPAINLEN